MLLLFLTLSIAAAQRKINEGTVIYTLSYELSADQQQYATMLPNELTCYFRGDSSAAIVNQGATIIKGVSVIKNNYHSLIIDLPAASKKIVVVLTSAEVEQENAGLPQFQGVKGTEKQVINGYYCTKVPVTEARGGANYDIWITNDIDMPPNSVNRSSSIFGGMPVKFVTFNNGFKINAVVKEIKEMSVPAGFFSASKDYESMSYTDLKAMSK